MLKRITLQNRDGVTGRQLSRTDLMRIFGRFGRSLRQVLQSVLDVPPRRVEGAWASSYSRTHINRKHPPTSPAMLHYAPLSARLQCAGLLSPGAAVGRFVAGPSGGKRRVPCPFDCSLTFPVPGRKESEHDGTCTGTD